MLKRHSVDTTTKISLTNNLNTCNVYKWITVFFYIQMKTNQLFATVHNHNSQSFMSNILTSMPTPICTAGLGWQGWQASETLWVWHCLSDCPSGCRRWRGSPGRSAPACYAVCDYKTTHAQPPCPVAGRSRSEKCRVRTASADRQSVTLALPWPAHWWLCDVSGAGPPPLCQTDWCYLLVF